MAMRKFGVNKDLWTELLDIIRNDEEFNPESNSLRGRKGRPYTAGRLDGEALRKFNAMRNLITYTIYSYQTPIAWRTDDGNWTVPEDRYSVTTTKHQGKVRTAITVLRNGSTLGMYPRSAVLHRGEAVRDWHNSPETHSYA